MKRSSGTWKNSQGKNLDRTRGDERILGDPDFVSKVLKAADEKIERKDHLLNSGWNLDKLVDSVCAYMSVNKEDLLKKGRKNRISAAKRLIAFIGCKELGIKSTEIAKIFGQSKQAVGKAIILGKKMTGSNWLKLLS